MIAVIASSPFFESIDRELRVQLVQPFSSRWIVWQAEPQDESGEEGDYALDDEEPSESLKTSTAVGLTHAISNGSSEGTCEVTERGDKSNADCTFVPAIPDCDEVDDPL